MTPHPVPATPTHPVPGEARYVPAASRERAAEGRPAPGSGAKVPLVPPAPARGRAPQTPAAGAGASPTSAAGLQAIAAAMSEAELEEHVRELCKGLGIVRIHVYNSRGTTPGVPDDILIGPRGVLWRELKTMRGKVTVAQQTLGEALRAAGQDWGVWRPSICCRARIARELAALAGLRAGAA